MRKLFKIHTVQKDDHRKFIYEDGKKTPIPDDGVVFLYKDKYGLLHATDWTDIAGSKTGVFLMTNEVQNHGGLPAVNGKSYTVWGATETYVYLTANKRKGAEFRFAREEKTEDGKKKIVVPHNDEKEMENCKLLADLYNELSE